MSAPAWHPKTGSAVSRPVCPCTFGPCDHCTKGDHGKCAFLLGTAPQRDASIYITDRKGYVPYFPWGHKPEMPKVYIIGGHTWHCPCDLDGHGITDAPAEGQLDLWGEVTA